MVGASEQENSYGSQATPGAHDPHDANWANRQAGSGRVSNDPTAAAQAAGRQTAIRDQTEQLNPGKRRLSRRAQQVRQRSPYDSRLT